jgi:stage V sporulation protein S
MESLNGMSDFPDSDREVDAVPQPPAETQRGPVQRTTRPLLFGTSYIQQQQRSTEVLKVSTRSRPSAVAGAIAGVIRDSGSVEVQSIGAGATNQAIKAVAIARSYLQEEGVDIVCVPSFIDVAIDAEERTAIRLLVYKRETSDPKPARAE